MNFFFFFDQRNASSEASFLASMLLSPLWTCVFHVSLQCQGVSGIIIVTMVTGFMLVYNSSSGGRSPSSTASSSSSSRRLDKADPSTDKPERRQRDQTSTLEGYTGVMDHKVNMHHLCTGRWSVLHWWGCNRFSRWNVISRPNYHMILNCCKSEAGLKKEHLDDHLFD